MSRLKQLFIALGILLTFNSTAFSQVEKFQALYIFNFCRFLEWPANSIGHEFVIGVVDNKTLETQLTGLSANRMVQNKPMKIIAIKSAEDAAKCQLVFVNSSQTGMVSAINTSTKNTLIVSDNSKSLGDGAGINFFTESSKLKFELHKGNISNEGLKVSSQLEQLASKIY